METLGPYYLSGSILSLIASLFVIGSYLKFRELRKHPSSIIYWRSWFDVFFSLQFIIEYAYDSSKYHCDTFSFIFQFVLLGSQMWYLMIAVDLFLALRNPFTDTKRNMTFYHLIVWTTSLLSSIILVGSRNSEYRAGMETCWIKSTSDSAAPNALNWVLFFVPTIICYVISAAVMFFAAYRLQKGLDETFKIRSQVLSNGQRYVIVFTAYWTICAIIYANIYSVEKDTTSDAIDPNEHLSLYGAFALVFAIRGVVDVTVWTVNEQVISAYRRWLAGAPPQEEAFTDINRALRKEVLVYSTQGIVSAVDQAQKLPMLYSPDSWFYPASLNFGTDPKNILSIPLRREDSEIKGDVPFFDYAPRIFRYLRDRFGIPDAEYTASIKGDTNAMIEKFTEGASGSFFYFSEDSRYIVKTLTQGEAECLLRLLPNYVNYMATNPHSLLCKFLGFHSIQLYTTTLYLVVMQSVFQTSKKIHARYDLKGSWVDRHANIKRGKVHGIFKDRDLNFLLSLQPSARNQFVEQITRDAYFLRDQGIMDYSLLLGVHNTRQPVLQLQRTSTELNRVHRGEDRVIPFHQVTGGGIKAKVVEGPGIYYFGIIDILQEYNTEKQLERYLKIFFNCKDPEGISAMPPGPYAQRFVRAMRDITEYDDLDAISPADVGGAPDIPLEEKTPGVVTDRVPSLDVPDVGSPIEVQLSHRTHNSSARPLPNDRSTLALRRPSELSSSSLVLSAALGSAASLEAVHVAVDDDEVPGAPSSLVGSRVTSQQRLSGFESPGKPFATPPQSP